MEDSDRERGLDMMMGGVLEIKKQDELKIVRTLWGVRGGGRWEGRLKEMGDNAREWGLDMMMGGELEIKKEDELKIVCTFVG